MKQHIILRRLLDKFERSKHLMQPGVSNKRVMLQILKKELPEYKYESAATRDECNDAAKSLEQLNLIEIEWVPGRPVINILVLNLNRIDDAYMHADRKHPKDAACQLCQDISSKLFNIRTSWIVNWKNEVCEQMQRTWKIPPICKQDDELLSALLVSLVQYDSLQGNSITMRAFSSSCYQDTKYFERVVRDSFLRIATKYCPELMEACEQGNLSIREQLAVLGIYARPELYELAGDFTIKTINGDIPLSPLSATGVAIPSTATDLITGFDANHISKMYFIENKTNYDEFLVSELTPDAMVVYHGGFFSPQKKKLIEKLAACAPKQIQFFFWGDIDLGGFQMFMRLQAIIPSLQSFRMSAADVERYAQMGLQRPAAYLDRLRTSLKENKFPLFEKSIEMILHYGVTIEQESFLTIS